MTSDNLSGDERSEAMDSMATLHVGWGRLIFGNTFESVNDIVEILRQETEDDRDIAIYVEEPHVALSLAPQDIFLDPSHTYRLDLARYEPPDTQLDGIVVRPATTRSDAGAINHIFAKHQMVPIPSDFLVRNRDALRLGYFVAQDLETGDIVGTVMGVDHKRAFNDPGNGSSLWGLAVDPQCRVQRVGEALVHFLAGHYKARGRSFMDLSVMHDNTRAIALYEKTGFVRVQTFTLKYKNPINERLYTAPQPEARLNPYAQIIINEARRRGIGVEIEDEEANLFTLMLGGRRIACRESLCELTSAVALQRCDDKALTRRLLAAHDLRVPDQTDVGSGADNAAFLDRHGRIVVKPARGEQGAGITVDVRTQTEMARAIDAARAVHDRVLLEEFCHGDDLRIIVIDFMTVAAAQRRPATVVGDGTSTVADLIDRQSRRRRAATGGESSIPLDAETRRVVATSGFDLTSVLEPGLTLAVRKTANLHTGGTIHDVTAALHPTLAAAAERAARALNIPVVGFDFLVPAVDEPDYVIIEANERPGLANHEPQPTAQRFIDMLFPQSARVQGEA